VIAGIPLELRISALAVLTLFLLWVVRLIRAQRLSVRDSLVWLLTTGGAMALALFPGLLARAAHLLGVQVASNAFFAGGLLYLAVNVLMAVLGISDNAARTRRLAQECAQLRAEVDALRAELRGEGRGKAPER
jgi:hypothetical protein